jgi:hypothetical protein
MGAYHLAEFYSLSLDHCKKQFCRQKTRADSDVCWLMLLRIYSHKSYQSVFFICLLIARSYSGKSQQSPAVIGKGVLKMGKEMPLLVREGGV